MEWSLYLSWSSLLVTSCRLEMNVDCVSKNQNRTIYIDRYKEYVFTVPVSQVNVKTMKKVLEQWSELQVAKCRIVHILSSSYNFLNFELWNEKKATQQWGFLVANDTVHNQDRVYHERVYADKVVTKVWFLRSFSSQHHCKFIANISFQKGVWHSYWEIQNHAFIFKVNLNFFRSSTQFNYDTAFLVSVFFLNESVDGFNKIRKGR